MSKPYRKELTGLTNDYGSTIISFAYMKNKSSYWNCKCACGTEFVVRGADFSNGHTKSCGCHKISRKKYNPETQKYKIKDLTNQRFGKLKVIKDSGKRDSGRCVIWICECDCGHIAEISSHCLRQGTVSCGQCKASKGEITIANILLENNIPFETQKSFDTLRFDDTNRKGFFDFYVNNKYIIEFDGIQHYDIRFGWNNEENFLRNQYHDLLKNNWCKQNNIPLIRIPYTHLNSLTLQDLLLETSSFIVQ